MWCSVSAITGIRLLSLSSHFLTIKFDRHTFTWLFMRFCWEGFQVKVFLYTSVISFALNDFSTKSILKHAFWMHNCSWSYHSRMVNSILKGTFLQKMNVNLKDICVSLENKEPTSQEKLEERTKLRQLNNYLHNFIQLTLWYWKLSLTILTSKVDENKKKLGEYIKNWQFGNFFFSKTQ